MKSTKTALLFLILIIVVSRLFFLDGGCGAEEDSYGVRLAAKHIAQTGQYEASRLPGHPLQELFYATIVFKTSIAGMNAITTFFSLIACLFFFLILKKNRFSDPLLATLMLAFTPIIYMHSTDCMDYIWALAFILMAYYWLLNDRVPWAAIMLGLAVGCRITSIVMVLPFVFHLLFFRKSNWRTILTLPLVTLAVSALLFIPVIEKYGIGFFHYYDQFPYPSLAKIIYKATIGVWGSIGCVAMLFILLFTLIFKRKTLVFWARIGTFVPLFTVVLLFIGLYVMLPQKSAYLIPLVPFVILLFAELLPPNYFRALAFASIGSVFFFGINLSDETRGAEASSISKTVAIGGQEVHFDLLYGPVIDDFLKRKARIEFTNKVIEKTGQLTGKSIVLSGWWLNPIQDGLNGKVQGNVRYVYCLDENGMKAGLAKGFKLFFLPEMDSINDLRYRISSTKELAQPLFEEKQ